MALLLLCDMMAVEVYRGWQQRPDGDSVIGWLQLASVMPWLPMCAAATAGVPAVGISIFNWRLASLY